LRERYQHVREHRRSAAVHRPDRQLGQRVGSEHARDRHDSDDRDDVNRDEFGLVRIERVLRLVRLVRLGQLR
jgi:hypothetical protein